MTKPYRACHCRGPSTTGPDGKTGPGTLLGRGCPELARNSRHGKWYGRYEAPAGPDGKRRQVRVGPFEKKAEAEAALREALTEKDSGAHADDKSTPAGAYLDRWLEWKRATGLKPSTAASYAEAIGLYFRPGIGHVKLGDLRESHLQKLYAAMRKLNRDEDSGEMLRRLVAARATWHGRRVSGRPLTDARIRRVHAVLRAALNDASIPVNPAARLKLGKARKRRPLLWTQARITAWRETGKVPAPVMVWDSAECGAFLDGTEGERLYALYHLTAYFGLRRSELAGLAWADVDLATRKVHIRQAQVDDELDDTKSEDSDRIITIDQATADVLRAWRKAQLAERMAWGPGWQDTGRVFTREDGAPLRPEWISERFATLVSRLSLPPVRLHDLRHGSATMLLAAGLPPKVVSEVLGHSTVAFTMDVYTSVAEELAESAASAIAAYVPRKGRTGTAE